MKAWVVTGVGAPGDVMERVDREPPRPGPGTLRVRVLVAGLSLPEVLMCRDAYPYKPVRPFTPGHEVCGVVLDPGAVPGFAAGDRVMGVTAFYEGRGGHAEEALVLGSAASIVPQAMSDEEAATFTIAYQTAWIGLVLRARLGAGECLLVHGAAGGTGFAAVQLGHALGARVIAVVRGEEKARRAREDGADAVIDRARLSGAEDRADAGGPGWLAAVREAAGPGGVDVVFDPVGGQVFEQSLACLAYGGRLVAIGFASGAWGNLTTADLVARNASVVGALAVPPDADAASEMRRALVDLYSEGSLRPRVTRVHAFEDLPKALAELDERRAVGKHVVRVSRGDAG